MIFCYVFLLAWFMMIVVCYWVVFVSSCLLCDVYRLIQYLKIKIQFWRRISSFLSARQVVFSPLHIPFEPNQHMITKFTFMICIIWWVTYSNTPNLSNIIPWSNMGIVLYFSSYAIATTLTLCSHSCLWYYCSKDHVIVIIAIVDASIVKQDHII
jgi:hypothetical protein